MNDNQHIQLWEKCLGIIRDILEPEQYDTWFKDIVSFKYDDDCLTLLVPSSFYAEMIDQKFIKVLRPALYRVYGEKVKLFYRYNTVQSAPESGVTQRSDNASIALLNNQQKAQPANPFQPPTQQDIDSQLNPRYTFENYCGGESNKVVLSIAEAVANDPKNRTFSPLFIFGDVGVGKTHLIQAIGIRMKEKNPRNRVLYVTARLFQNQYTTAVARKSTNSFFHFYQSIDTLIIDDIQDLKDLPGTQNMFFHIFNHLHQNDKLIIMSSDRAPADMSGFEDRMLSRFRWGMSAQLKRPDLELRKCVLAQKAEQDGIDLSADVRDFIASHVTASIRDLEGIMVSLIAHAAVLNCPVSLELARQVVGNLVKVDTKPISFELLADKVCSHYNIETDLLYTKTRKREISDARQMLMYMAKIVAKMQLVDIGRLLDRTHATVNYAVNSIEERLGHESQLQADLQAIQASL